MDTKQRDELERLLSQIEAEKVCEVIPVKFQSSLARFLKKLPKTSAFVRQCVVQHLQREIEESERF